MNFTPAPQAGDKWIRSDEAAIQIGLDYRNPGLLPQILVEALSSGSLRAWSWWLAEKYVGGAILTNHGIEHDENETDAIVEALTRDPEAAKYTLFRPIVAEYPHSSCSVISACYEAGEVPLQVWKALSEEDTYAWDWDKGLFVVSKTVNSSWKVPVGTLFPDGEKAFTYGMGLHFYKDDFKGFLTRLKRAKSAEGPKQGAPPSQRWANWAAYLVLLDRDEGVEEWSANKLKDELESRMLEDGLSPVGSTQAREAAAYFLNAIRGGLGPSS